jgi:hypothetical protein
MIYLRHTRMEILALCEPLPLNTDTEEARQFPLTCKGLQIGIPPDVTALYDSWGRGGGGGA